MENPIKIIKLAVSNNRVLVGYEIKKEVHPQDLAQAIREGIDRLYRDYKAVHDPKIAIEIEEIEELVCQQMRIDPDVMKSRNRRRDILVPRQVAIAMAMKFTRFSSSYVGVYFGGRDHATVLHSCKVVKNTWMDDTLYGYGPIVRKIYEILELLNKTRKYNATKKRSKAQVRK